LSVTVATLRADVPGFLGLLPDDTGIAALLRFEDTDPTVAPRDDLGALSAVRPVGSSFPDVVDGYTSRARDFDGATALQASDDTGALILERTVSIVALLEWDHASTAGPDTIAAHGVRGSASERRSWHLRLSKIGGGVGRVAWIWEDRAGTEYVQDGGDFFLPASGYSLVSATREWCGDRFELRYWVGETLLAQHEISDIEVGGGIDATVTIGCVGDGGGGFAEHFHGRLDQLAVFRSALTQAQVRHIWQRMAVWGPDLYLALRDLQPIGTARTRAPASLVQRRIRAQSGGLAAASALVALRSDAGLPDRAFGPRLELWERTTAIQAQASDSVGARQARVLAALRGEQGLSAEKIRENLAPLYGLPEGELEVIRYDNVTLGVDYPAWDERGAGGVIVDEPAGELTLRVPAFASWSTVLGDYAYRTSIGAEPVLTATIDATSLSNDDLFVGFADPLGTMRAGVRLDTSALQLVNQATGANIATYTLPVTIRVFLDGGSTVKAKVNGGANISLGAAPAGLTYAELALVPTTSSVPATARSAQVSDLRVQNLDSRATQVGYVYGATATDTAGARRQLARQQPAHTHCAVLVGKRAVVCDDVIHGSDAAPCVETQRDYAVSWLPGVGRIWAGNEADLVAGALLTAAGGAGIDAGVPHDGPFGDQCLVFSAGLTDRWTLPTAASINFTNTKTTVLVLVYNIDSLSGGTEYTLIGNREGADLNGFEVAFDTSGNLVVRFDSGAGAPTVVTLLPTNVAPDFWHALVVKYDHLADLITVVTELELGTAAFTASASSTTPAALGAYRSLQTPAWRCPLLAVFDEEAAEAVDPVAMAKYVHRVYANYPDHVEQLRRVLTKDEAPRLCWAGSSIDDADALEVLQRSGGASILQVPLTSLAGPFALSVSTAQAWIASDATIGHLDADSSALIVVCADLVSFTAATFENFCGDRTVVSNAGWELFMHSSGVPAFALDDNVGVAQQALLTAASATIGKHAYLIRWNGATQQAAFVSEVDSATLNFAGRSPVNTAAFRIGKTRGDLNGVNWNALHVAILYTAAFDALSTSELVALAAKLKAEV
jgi:hypothetical protein